MAGINENNPEMEDLQPYSLLIQEESNRGSDTKEPLNDCEISVLAFERFCASEYSKEQ